MTNGRRERVPLGRVWCAVRQYAYHAILNSPNRDGGGPTTSYLVFFRNQLNCECWSLETSGTGSRNREFLLSSYAKHITSECGQNATFSWQRASLWILRRRGWIKLCLETGVTCGQTSAGHLLESRPEPAFLYTMPLFITNTTRRTAVMS